MMVSQPLYKELFHFYIIQILGDFCIYRFWGTVVLLGDLAQWAKWLDSAYEITQAKVTNLIMNNMEASVSSVEKGGPKRWEHLW